VTWRDGVHLTGTSIWCDARRRREVCFASSADRLGRTGHGQLIATPLTLALVGASSGNLAVPLRQRFTLGTLRIELIASGRGPGAACLYVEGEGKKLLYAGVVRPYEGTRFAGADVRACETLVVDAPASAAKRKAPSLDAAIDKTLSWTRAQLAAGKRPILMVETALDGLEVATVLGDEGFALAGAKPIRDAVLRAKELSDGVRRAKRTNGKPATSLVMAAPGREVRATIWLAGTREAPAVVTDKPHTTALLSGTMDVVDATFAWSSGADRTQLLAWIESTRAKEVFVTGASADAIVKVLGDKAKFLGPPQQMSLFAEVS
jgi:Cft2 family RNA processing exonuclease